jgi:hypothetical protein
MHKWQKYGGFFMRERDQDFGEKAVSHFDEGTN